MTTTEFIVFICTLIGGIAAIYGIVAYFKDHVKKPKEQIVGLQVQFLSNQKIATDLRDNLIQYAHKHNAYDEYFFKGITFRDYINLLTKTLGNDLSNAAIENAVKVKPTESITRSLSVSLDEQCKNLLAVKSYFELYFGNSAGNELGSNFPRNPPPTYPR